MSQPETKQHQAAVASQAAQIYASHFIDTSDSYYLERAEHCAERAWQILTGIHTHYVLFESMRIGAL